MHTVSFVLIRSDLSIHYKPCFNSSPRSHSFFLTYIKIQLRLIDTFTQIIPKPTSISFGMKNLYLYLHTKRNRWDMATQTHPSLAGGHAGQLQACFFHHLVSPVNSWISSKAQILTTTSSYPRKTEDQNHMWCHQVQINWLQLSASVDSDQLVWTSTRIPDRYYRSHSNRVNSSKCLFAAHCRAQEP